MNITLYSQEYLKRYGWLEETDASNAEQMSQVILEFQQFADLPMTGKNVINQLSPNCSPVIGFTTGMTGYGLLAQVKSTM